MLSRLARSLRSSSRPQYSIAVAPRGDRRYRSAADSVLDSRHGQDLLLGLRHRA